MQHRSSFNEPIESSAPASSGLERLRQQLLIAYDGACAISGCQVDAVLRPVLIDPNGPAEPYNALLLRADLQQLFQSGLLTVDAMTLEVLVAPALQNSEYSALAGKRLRQPKRLPLRPSRHMLAAHHRLFQLERPSLDSCTARPPSVQRSLAVQSWVKTLAFSPDQQTLATGSLDGKLRLWQWSDGQLQRVLSSRIDEINAVAFSPDGQRIAAAGRQDGVQVWRVADGEPLLYLGNDQRHGALFSVAFQPNGDLIAATGWAPVIWLWNATDGSVRGGLSGHEGFINSLAFHPRGDLLLSGGQDRIVRLWRIPDRSLVREMHGHDDEILSVTFSTDGELAASASADGVIIVWQVAHWQPVQMLPSYAGACSSLAFSPDNRYLASAHDGRTVLMWQVSNGELRWELQGHGERVTCVAFAPRGNVLASGSFDAVVRIWAYK